MLYHYEVLKAIPFHMLLVFIVLQLELVPQQAKFVLSYFTDAVTALALTCCSDISFRNTS